MAVRVSVARVSVPYSFGMSGEMPENATPSEGVLGFLRPRSIFADSHIKKQALFLLFSFFYYFYKFLLLKRMLRFMLLEHRFPVVHYLHGWTLHF